VQVELQELKSGLTELNAILLIAVSQKLIEVWTESSIISKLVSMEELLGDKMESELEWTDVVAGWRKFYKYKYVDN
jgi:hypothetical protein